MSAILASPADRRRELLPALPAAAGLALLVVSPSGAQLVVGLGLLVAAFAVRPSFALPLLGLLLPFYLMPRELGSMAFSLPELVLLSALGGAALHGLRRLLAGNRPSLAALSSPLDAPVALLLAAALLSLLASEVLRVSVRELRTLILEPLAACYLCLWFVREKGDLARLLAGLLLGGGLAAGMGLYQFLFTEHVVAVEGARRILGPYLSPNHLGLYLGRLLPLALALALFAPRSNVLLGITQGVAREDGPTPRHPASATQDGPLPALQDRVAWAFVALLIATALVLTVSLGAWLATLPAVAAVLLLWRANDLGMRGAAASMSLPAVAAVVAVGVLLIVLGTMLGGERIASHLSPTQGSGFIRLQVWQSAIDMIRDHPLLGVGMDNFLYHYRSGYILAEAVAEPDLSHPHNLVLDFWLQLGVFGVVAFAWLLVTLGRMGRCLWEKYPDPLVRAALAGTLGATVDLLAHGMVDNSYFLVDLAYHFWLSAGVLAALWRASRRGGMPLSRSGQME